MIENQNQSQKLLTFFKALADEKFEDRWAVGWKAFRLRKLAQSLSCGSIHRFAPSETLEAAGLVSAACEDIIIIILSILRRFK